MYEVTVDKCFFVLHNRGHSTYEVAFWFFAYRISVNSFGGNYSFLSLWNEENSNSCRKFHFFYLINWIFAAETIQGRKLFNGGNYSRKDFIEFCILLCLKKRRKKYKNSVIYSVNICQIYTQRTWQLTYFWSITVYFAISCSFMISLWPE